MIDLPPCNDLPPLARRTGNAFTRWFGTLVLRLGGWRVVGEFPNIPKLVMLAAPHSSAWDAVWGLAVRMKLGVDVRFMAKREAFWWPLGVFLRAFGGVPIDRSSASGVVGGMVEELKRSERLWMLLAPEGTRKRVEKWKSGFWHIAMGADVPVLCVFFHYPEKVVGIGKVLRMSGNLAADMAAVREYYRPFIGKHRGTT